MSDLDDAILEVDVLIVGAGIQGLWLLNDLLEAGRSALLIEQESVGGEQTLHSHGFIHQGIGYPHCDHLSDFRQAADRWRQFIAPRPNLISHSSAHVGFVGLANSLLWENHWKEAGLAYHLESSLNLLSGSSIRKLYRTNEFAVHLVRLIERLSEPVRKSIVHGRIHQIAAADGRVSSVRATIGGLRYTIRPQSLVLTAGQGNAGLLSQIDGISQPESSHYLRKSQVVVVRSQSLLDHVNLLIPDIWLFIVSQPDDDGRPVWLVTSDVDKAHDAHLTPDADSIQHTVAKLRFFDPSTFSRENVEKMQWSAYVGLKVEPESSPNGPPPLHWRTKTFGFDNLLAVWPTKLTFAPLASADVVARINEDQRLPKSSRPSAHFNLPRQSLTLRKEKWRTVEWHQWNDFCKMNGLRN